MIVINRLLSSDCIALREKPCNHFSKFNCGYYKAYLNFMANVKIFEFKPVDRI